MNDELYTGVDNNKVIQFIAYILYKLASGIEITEIEIRALTNIVDAGAPVDPNNFIW